MSQNTEPPPELGPLALYFVGVVGLIIGILLLGHFLGPRRTGRGRLAPFESGIVPLGFGRFRTSVHFYVVAILFVIFDMEAVFIFAWAVAVEETGWTGYAAFVLFVVILVVALAYEWALGALDWAPRGPDSTRRHATRRG